MKIAFVTLLSLASLTMNAQKSKNSDQYLALGDSYTIGESVAEPDRWPNQLLDSLRRHGMKFGKSTIIATTGWRTDDLKRAVSEAHLKNEYGLVSLLIGVNNQYQGKPVAQYAVEFEELLKTAILLAGGKKENVFVVSIPDYGYTPFGKAKQSTISAAIDEFNTVNKRITKKNGVQYVDITDISRKGLQRPDLVAPDGLHPSGKMYALWVERIFNLKFKIGVTRR
jgi:lysophospholipase L1-like esterase